MQQIQHVYSRAPQSRVGGAYQDLSANRCRGSLRFFHCLLIAFETAEGIMSKESENPCRATRNIRLLRFPAGPQNQSSSLEQTIDDIHTALNPVIDHLSLTLRSDDR